MNFILFNGPPRSGKDTAARIAWDHIASNPAYVAIWEKFSFPNKRMFAGMMDTKCDTWGMVQYYEGVKESIVPEIGVSYRQFQIDVSEKFMKPLYGNDIFGKLLLSRCRKANEEITSHEPFFIVSDCGFQIECDVLADHNVLFFNLIRPDTSYAGDSRQEVVPNIKWMSYRILNDGPLEHLNQVITSRIDTWLQSL